MSAPSSPASAPADGFVPLPETARPGCYTRKGLSGMSLYMTRRLFIGLLLLAPIAAAGQARPSATELAQSVQQKYDRVKDFTADFTHTYEGGVLKKKTTE